MSSIFELLGSAWIPDLLLAAVTLHFRMRNGSWLAPSSFMGMYWFGNLTGSLLAVDHRVPALGTWVLVSLIATVQSGSAMVEMDTPSPRPERELGLADSIQSRISTACMAFLLIGIFACIYFVWLTLNLFKEEITFVSVLQMAAKWTFLRYDGFSDPWALRLTEIWVYPAALLGGFLVGLAKKFRLKVLGFTSLLPCLLLSLFAGARSGFLLGLACWLGGNWAVRVAVADGVPTLFRKKTVLSTAGLAMGLLLLYVGINGLRAGKDVSDARDLRVDFNAAQIRNYMFGTPSAFASWFNRGDRGPRMWGALTLQGVYDTLHIREKTSGTYTDSGQTVGLEGTNIFTMFRGLIQDFTLPGAFLICAVWGLLSGYAYAKRTLETGNALRLAAFYTIALFSALYCPFAFNSTILVWLVAWFVIRHPSDTLLRVTSRANA